VGFASPKDEPCTEEKQMTHSHSHAKHIAPRIDSKVDAQKPASRGLNVKTAVRAGYAEVQTEPVAVDGYQPQYY
jgi:hypothetical protein